MADHSGFLAVARGASFYKADLHLHSFGSSPDVIDEGMTPTAIIETARGRGLGLIALTDHNSVAGVADLLEAARATNSVTAIPGVEITTSYGHVLPTTRATTSSAYMSRVASSIATWKIPQPTPGDGPGDLGAPDVPA